MNFEKIGLSLMKNWGKNEYLHQYPLLAVVISVHKKISKRIYEILPSEENDVVYSQASLWEIAIQYNLGKLILKGITLEEFFQEVKGSYFRCKVLDNDELITFYRLPIEHKDPIERMLIWQAIRSDYYFLSAATEVDRYKKYGLKVLP